MPSLSEQKPETKVAVNRFIVNETFLTIVNPAAGGGKSAKLVAPALERLRSGGVELEVVETHAVGDATRITRDAYARGYRKFLAVGGDGTSYEVVNGIFPAGQLTSGEEQDVPTLRYVNECLRCTHQSDSCPTASAP